jgi:hypothetical protein
VFAFSLSKPCKEGEGNKKDVSFCSLFHSLYWKFEKLYDNNKKNIKQTLGIKEKKARKFLKRVVLVNIEQGIWWQQLLGPRVKKSKERERGPLKCRLVLSFFLTHTD